MDKIEAPRRVSRPDGHVTIFELTASRCHWPLWSNQERPEAEVALYCGAAVPADVRYCKTHAALAYNPKPAALRHR